MRKPNNILANLLLSVALFAASDQMFHASGQNAAPAESAPSKLKEKWMKALTDARQDFQKSNDRESSEFVGSMLASLEQPAGLAPAALAANVKRMQKMTRDLVRRGALESASTLHWAQWPLVNEWGAGADGPNIPARSGASPGPGGLVLYLPFDAPDENGVVRDVSGASNNGHVHGAKWVSGGKFGGAYQFSLTNLDDRVVIPNSELLNPEHITLAAWIKTPDLDGFWNRIVDKDYRKGYELCLGGDFNREQHRGMKGFQVNGMWMSSDHRLSDELWHHVAGTYDGQVSRLYLDGVELTHDKASRPGPISKNKWDLCIGNSVVDYGTDEICSFDGLIDEVRIYNRALSANEIKALATATHAGVDAATPPADMPPKQDASTRLKKVKTLFDQGLINKEDYDKKVKEIMDSL